MLLYSNSLILHSIYINLYVSDERSRITLMNLSKGFIIGIRPHWIVAADKVVYPRLFYMHLFLTLKLLEGR